MTAPIEEWDKAIVRARLRVAHAELALAAAQEGRDLQIESDEAARIRAALIADAAADDGTLDGAMRSDV